MSRSGKILYFDSDEKLIAKLAGRISLKKVKEAMKAHVEYMLKDLEPGLVIPLENVEFRESKEIDEIASKSKPLVGPDDSK